jgi:hypothetical protein
VGLSVDRVEVKDIALPESMRRSMSRQAEAERERRARIIAADGEYQPSAKLTEAAQVMSGSPGALQLRLLQTVTEVASDRTSTLIMPFPIELLRFFENVTRTDAAPATATGSTASAVRGPAGELPDMVDGPATDGGDAAGSTRDGAAGVPVPGGTER